MPRKFGGTQKVWNKPPPKKSFFEKKTENVKKSNSKPKPTTQPYNNQNKPAPYELEKACLRFEESVDTRKWLLPHPPFLL